MEKYNGWANYETWRVHLEMLDGMTAEDFGISVSDVEDDRDDAVSRLSRTLGEFVYEAVESQASGFALDIAQSFLNSVDWYEIADHFVTDIDYKIKWSNGG
jgi:hypothetical protein